MRFFAILLALLFIDGCKVDGPVAPGANNELNYLLSRQPKTQWVICWDGSKVRYGKPCSNQPAPPPPPTQICPDGSVIPADQVCPALPPPSGWEPSPSLDGAAPIASEFDPMSGTIKIPLPGSMYPDVVGAFRFDCDAGQLLNDDPIVFPGQPGKSHLHQFYGNTGANAFSTYKSLRTSGDSTCSVSPLNRSAYWMPAMLDGKGNVVRPEHVKIYYKRRPKSDPKCSLSTDPRGEGECIPLPNGLKFIFGFDMVTDRAPSGSLYFMCKASGVHEANLEGATIQSCPAGSQVGAIIKAPGCWDGKNLDSPNHRDHVAYAVRDPNYGYMQCPKTHPYVIPGFTLQAWWDVLPSDTLSTWSLSSDAMRPLLPHGSTFHTDFFMAWDPMIHGMWEANCIDKLLSCNSGDLGNGLQMRNVLKADPHLVPIP